MLLDKRLRNLKDFYKRPVSTFGFYLGDERQRGRDKDRRWAEEQADTIDTTSMFNNATFGGNTTIVVGHHNVQSVRNELAGDARRARIPALPLAG